MFVRKSKYNELLLELDEVTFLLEITTKMLSDLNKQEAKKRHPSAPKKPVAKRKAVKEL
jgi:hypothetical protein